MEIKQETYHALGDSTDRLIMSINHSMETLDTVAAGINQFKFSLKMMEGYVMEQKKQLLKIIIDAPFPQPKPFPEEESTTEEEEDKHEEEEQKIEEEEEESSTTTSEEEQQHEEEEEEEEQATSEEEESAEDKKIAIIAPAPEVPIAETADARYARKPYQVLLQVSQKAYNQYAYLYKKVIKIINEGKEFDGQMFQHHLACISFLIKTKIADVPQLLENTKSAVHWVKKLKKTEGYKNNKEAQKFTGKLLETLRRMKTILKSL